MISREVRGDRCYDLKLILGVPATKNKRVWTTLADAQSHCVSWTDQEPYVCTEETHWHCRTIEKHIQRDLRIETHVNAGMAAKIPQHFLESEENRRRTDVRRLHAEGLSVRDIADRLDSSPATIRKDHKRMGLVPNVYEREQSEDVIESAALG